MLLQRLLGVVIRVPHAPWSDYTSHAVTQTPFLMRGRRGSWEVQGTGWGTCPLTGQEGTQLRSPDARQLHIQIKNIMGFASSVLSEKINIFCTKQTQSEKLHLLEDPIFCLKQLRQNIFKQPYIYYSQLSDLPSACSSFCHPYQVQTTPPSDKLQHIRSAQGHLKKPDHTYLLWQLNFSCQLLRYEMGSASSAEGYIHTKPIDHRLCSI